MRISNVRMGHAANSSSLHSLVLNNGHLVDEVHQHEPPSRNVSYGWAEFTAASREEKWRYMIAQLRHSLTESMPANFADIIVKSWAPPDIEGLQSDIDHQSILNLPVQRECYAEPKDEEHVDLEFAKAFASWIAESPDFAVVGGNDNEDPVLYPDETRIAMPFRAGERGDLWARKDGPWWVIYNRRTGTKITMSFEETEGEYTKATHPELVDLKITDYCNLGCTYCYQGSTPLGAHGGSAALGNIIRSLGAMGVFEVAIGGGEPTTHPRFVYILETVHENAMTPNFTTATFEWLENEGIVEMVRDVVRRVAYSPRAGMWETLGVDLRRARHKLETREDWSSKVGLHLVMGVATRENLIAALDEVPSENITLLGFKRTGRGSRYLETQEDNAARRREEEVLNFLAGYIGWAGVGIDTAFVKNHAEWLREKAHAERMTVRGTEGTHSMYIDGVAGIMKKSSYEDEGTPFDRDHDYLDTSLEVIERTFQSWR